MRLYFVRHAATTWNRDGTIMGALPIPIVHSEAGRLHRVGEYLAKCGVRNIVTSPVVRAMQSARAMSQFLQEGDRRIEQAFREREWGTWEGRPIAHYVLAKSRGDGIPVGVEPREAVRVRALEALERLREPLTDQVAVVTHKIVISVLLEQAIGRHVSARIDNCSVTEIDQGPEGTLVVVDGPTSF